jgi:hypothetical protein
LKFYKFEKNNNTIVMRKKLLLFLLSLGITASGQVGINTNNPQNTFHVDGGKDNSLTDVPTSTQQANDFIITSAGNVGLGTISPTVKLELNNGTTNGAIKIVDGTQGADKVLMSDANGVGTWRTSASVKLTAQGFFPSTPVTTSADNGSTPKYTGIYIDLTQGRWVVNAGMTIYNNASNSRYWLHAYLSSTTSSVTQNGFVHLGPSGNSTAYAGVMTNSGSGGNDSTLNFISGSSVINVISSSTRIYLLMENKPTNYWGFGTNYNENYFYAIPIN